MYTFALHSSSLLLGSFLFNSMSKHVCCGHFWKKDGVEREVLGELMAENGKGATEDRQQSFAMFVSQSFGI